MTRRDFFRRFLPLGNPSPAAQNQNTPLEHPEGEEVRELFTKAMELGIDPATVDPRTLRRLVARHEPNDAITDDKKASGPDLTGLPDAPRRPQQRGGPDGDKRLSVFVP
jgi:hypothetical protein